MAKPKTDTSSPDEVPYGIDLLSAHLCDIKIVLEKMEEQMIERNALLRGSDKSAGSAEVPQSSEVLDRLERLEAGIPSRLDAIVAGVAQLPGLIGKLDARLTKLETFTGQPPPVEMKIEGAKLPVAPVLASRPEIPVVSKKRGRKPDPEKCPHPGWEALPNNLRRCTRCGLVLEAEVAQVVEETKPEPKVAVVEVKAAPPAEEVFVPVDGKMVEQAPEPAPEQPVTIDDVRSVAIGYATRHGKDKLSEVLKKYGQGNLSSVPAEKYKTLLAELSNGV